jgi:hypothetical protein
MSPKNTTHTTKSTTTPKTQASAPAPETVNSTAVPLITSTANGSNNGTKTDLQTSYVALIAGLQAYYQPSDVLQLPTGNETRDQVIADLQKFVQSAQDTKAAYQAYRAAVQNERAIEALTRTEKQAVQSVVQGRFGKSSATLLQFGMQPRKPPSKTAASKAEAVVKSEATRKARGTKGSKQKLEVSGNVTGVVITPITSTQNVPTPASEPALVTPATPASAPVAATPAVKPSGS